MVTLVTHDGATHLIDATVEQFARWGGRSSGTPPERRGLQMADFLVERLGVTATAHPDVVVERIPRGWRRGGEPWVIRPRFLWMRQATYTAVPVLGDDPMGYRMWHFARENLEDLRYRHDLLCSVAGIPLLSAIAAGVGSAVICCQTRIRAGCAVRICCQL